MASTASSFIQSINTAFPVAGVDNDTQGFRDNYANIKNGMTSLANEVSSIQASGTFKNATNDFEQNIIQNAQFQSSGDKVVNKTVLITNQGGNQTVDYAEGNYQVWKLNSATNFSFVNFPDPSINGAIFSSVKLELFTENTQTVAVSLVASTSTSILLDKRAGTVVQNPIALSTSSPVIYEVSSRNGDAGPFYVTFVGGPYKV